MTERLNGLIQALHQYEHTVEGLKGDQTYYLPLDTIIYMESVDKRSFLYTMKEVYESRQNLLSLENDCTGATLTRISKSTLLNVSYLKCVTPYPNHRLQAELKNGERLVVSRKYISSLMETIRREYHA